MSLRQWLKEKEIDPEKVVAIHPATDGFKQGRDNLMSISVTGGARDFDLGTAYVAGADAEKVQEYTGVSPEVYQEYMMSLEELEGVVKEILDQASFAVIWYAKYSKKWLDFVLPDLLVDVETLDLMPLVKAQDHKMDLPMDVDTIRDLDGRLGNASFHVKGGYGFDDVCARVIPGVDGDTADAYLTGSSPKLERRVYKLYALWKAVLDR